MPERRGGSLLKVVGGAAAAAFAMRRARGSSPDHVAPDPAAEDEFEVWRIPTQRIGAPTVANGGVRDPAIVAPEEPEVAVPAAPARTEPVEAPAPVAATAAPAAPAEPAKPPAPAPLDEPEPPDDDDEDEDDDGRRRDGDDPSFLTDSPDDWAPALEPRREPTKTPAWAVPAALTVIAAVALVLRWIGAQESLFGDELFTHRIVTADSFSEFLDRFESTPNSVPPVFFVLAWLTAKLGDPLVLLRLPSVLAGVAAVPVLYLLAKRLGGRQAGVIAAALFAVQPFAVFYGTEGRSYGLLLLLLPLLTLALLRALDGGGARWWAVYGVAAAAAIYTHYVAGLALAVMGLWALVVAREHWRAIVAVNVVVLASFIPWTPHLDDDALLARAIEVLHPLNFSNVVGDPLRVAFAHPFADAAEVPGVLSLFLLALAVVGAVCVFVVARRRRPATGAAGRPTPSRRLREERWLMALLVVGPPFLAHAYSRVEFSIYLPRNLITMLPYLCVGVAILLAALPRRACMAVAAVIVLAAGVATTRSLAEFERPDLRSAAEVIEDRSPPGTRVVEPLVFKGAELSQDLALHLDDRYPLSHDLKTVARGGGEVWMVAPVDELRPRVLFAAKAAGAQLVEQHTFEGLFDVHALRFRLTGPAAPGDLTARAGIPPTSATSGKGCSFDYNQDGLSDLLLPGAGAQPWRLLAGKADGTFMPAGAATFPRADRQGCATGDFNGDDRPDFYVSLSRCAAGCTMPAELWIQTADGKFVDRAAEYGLDALAEPERPPLTLDGDGDGRLDLFTGIAATGSESPLWLNRQGRSLERATSPVLEPIDNACAAAGNLDGDAPDELLVCGGREGSYFLHLFDNTDGRWAQANDRFGLPDYGRTRVEAADMDGDDRLDLVSVSSSALEVRLNEDGKFARTHFRLELEAGRDIAVADADGDGRRDIYVVQAQNATQPDLLLLNKGSKTRFRRAAGLPQTKAGDGESVVAVPGYRGMKRAAFVVENGGGAKPGPRMLVQLPRAGGP